MESENVETHSPSPGFAGGPYNSPHTKNTAARTKPASALKTCAPIDATGDVSVPGSVHNAPSMTAVTASHSHKRARERESCCGNDRDVDIKRPVIRFVGSDQERRHEGANDAEARERGSVQQSCRERQQGDNAEQDEGRP